MVSVSRGVVGCLPVVAQLRLMRNVHKRSKLARCACFSHVISELHCGMQSRTTRIRYAAIVWLVLDGEHEERA